MTEYYPAFQPRNNVYLQWKYLTAENKAYFFKCMSLDV